MSDPVEFIERKLAIVDKVAKESPEKVASARQYATDADEPVYEYDDDYRHPLTGDPLTIILLAEATRKLMELHVPVPCPGEGDLLRLPVCKYCEWEWPCQHIELLAAGWGWEETP